jgi:hypothetical protein
VLLSNNSSFFSRTEIAAVADKTPTLPGLRVWTDNYSSLLPILQLTRH